MSDDIQRPTPERIARAGDQVEDYVTDKSQLTRRMLDNSVLDMLLSRNSITGEQFAAGVRFYEDWHTAGFASSGVVDPANIRVDGGGRVSMQDRQIDALGRHRRVVKLLGEQHSDVLCDVVLLEETLVSYGRKVRGLKDDKDCRLVAITLLSSALTQLDLIYYGKRTARTVAHVSEKATNRPDLREKVESAVDV